MAKNRESKVCGGNITALDKELKSRYSVGDWSVGAIAMFRSGILDDTTLTKDGNPLTGELLEYMDTYYSSDQDKPEWFGNTKSADNSEEAKTQYKNTIAKHKEIVSNICDAINLKLAKHQELTQEEDRFLTAFLESINAVVSDYDREDIIKNRMIKAGVTSSEVPELYEIYKDAIPNPSYRQEITYQILSLIFGLLDHYHNNPQYQQLTTEELINIIGPSRIFKTVKNRLTDASENGPRNYLQNKLNELKKSTSPSKEDLEKIAKIEFGISFIDSLINDKDGKLWSACLLMAKSTFAKATKIKIVTDTSSTKRKQVAVKLRDDELKIENEEEEYDAEQESPEHWMLKTDTISTFNTMSADIKMMLYQLSTNEMGILGCNDIQNVIKTYRKLINLRYTSGSQNSDEFIAYLGKLPEEDYPFIPALFDILNEDRTGNLKTKLFNTLKKNSLHYSIHNVMYDYIADNDTNSKTLHRTIYRNTEQISDSFKFGNYATTVLNIHPDNDICIFKVSGSIDKDKLNNFISDFRDNIVTLSGDESKENRREVILKANNYLNLHLTEQDVDNLVNNTKDYQLFIQKMYNTAFEFGRNPSVNNFNAAIENSQISSALNKTVAQARKYFLATEDVTESVVRFNKSTYQIVTIPNYIGDTFERLFRHFNKGSLKEYLEEKYLKCPIFSEKTQGVRNAIANPILRLLYEASTADSQEGEEAKDFTKDFLTSITRGLGEMDKIFENFSELDNIVFSLIEYLDKYEQSDGKLGRMPLFITGDSNSSRFMTCPVFSSEDALESLVDLAMSELDKQETLNAFIEMCKIKNYPYSKAIETNKDKFTLFPSLNVHKSDIDALTSKEAKRKLIKSYVERELNTLFKDDFLKTLRRENILQGDLFLTLNPEKISSPYISSLRKDKALNREFLYNMYLNIKLGIISQQQLLTIDTAFYNDVIDLQKRYKEMIASGETLDLSANWNIYDKEGKIVRTEKVAIRETDESKKQKRPPKNEHQTCIYLKDIFRNSNEGNKAFIKCLQANGVGTDKISKYSKNNLTDGQGYRSFPSYRRIMIMRGLWTPNMQRVYDIIERAHNENRELTKEEHIEIHNLNVIFQPIKPFYYGFEHLDNGTIIPVQHKYAEIPLIPELLPSDKNSTLRNLGKYMWDNDVDLACFDSCVKVGGYGSVDISNVTDYNSLSTTLDEAATHYLHLEGYRQQTNVPEHNDTTRNRGVQFMKHLFGCINLAESSNKHYGFLNKFKDHKIYVTKDERGVIDISNGLSPLNMVKYYGAIASIGYLQGCTNLIKKLNSNINMSRTLSELHSNDSRSSKESFSSFKLDKDGEFVLSPAEGANAPDNISALFSLFKKQVVKQGMQGGSAVQASAFGYDDVLKMHYSKDGTNVTYADCTMPFDLSVNDGNGNKIKLDYFEYVDPYTGNLLKEDGTAFTDEEIDELEANGVEWRKLSKLEKQYPGICDIIAYRIPTEKAYSMINLKIRKFTPRTMGGIIMVPSEYTTIAGFDFRQYWSH